MAFTQFKLDIATEQARGIFNQYVYETDDTVVEVQVSSYFNESRFSDSDSDWFGSLLTAKCSDGTFTGEITTGGTVVPIPGSSFNPQTDIAIERLIEGVSLATDQQPTGLGISNAMNIEFGAAIGTGGDDVQLEVGGRLIFNTGGLYRIKVVFQFGRTGSNGTSEVLFRFLVNGVQLGRTVGVKLGNADELRYIDIDNWFNVPTGATLDTQVMRDDSGNDSGGLFQTVPTDEGAGTWNDVPSAVIRVERWV